MSVTGNNCVQGPGFFGPFGLSPITLQTAYNGGTTITTTSTLGSLNLAGDTPGIDFTDGSSLAVSAANHGRIRYNNTSHTFQTSVNNGAFADIGGGATSLQASYNGGATISTGAGGAVAISDTAADNNSVLAINKTPAGAQSGSVATITSGANASGIVLALTANGSGIALSLAGATTGPGIDFTDGSSLTVSALSHGRIRYNDTTHTFQTSVNNGAFADIGGGGGITPQFGRVIRSLAQSINSNSTTTLIYNSIINDEMNGYNTGTGVFTVPTGKSGLYLIGFELTWDANVTGVRSGWINVSEADGKGYYVSNINTNPGSNQIVLTVQTIYRLAVNDTFQISVWQNSGIALNIVAGDPVVSAATQMYWARIGA